MDRAILIQALGQAEIGELEPARVDRLIAGTGHQDIRGLQVAMDDPEIVRGLDHPGERGRDPGRFRWRDGLAAKSVGEAAAFDQLQAQVGDALVFADVVDRDDLGMAEPCDRHRLLAIPLDGLARCVRTGGEHLQRDQAIEFDLPGLVDDT